MSKFSLAERDYLGGKALLDRIIPVFQQAAESGNARACTYLGDIYNRAEGISRDTKRAFEYYRCALAGGVYDVLSDIGLLYLDGDGIAKNIDNALYFFQMGKEKGDLWSTYYLGYVYLTGPDGLRVDIKRAAEYFKVVIDALSQRKQLDAPSQDLLKYALEGLESCTTKDSAENDDAHVHQSVEKNQGLDQSNNANILQDVEPGNNVVLLSHSPEPGSEREGEGLRKRFSHHDE